MSEMLMERLLSNIVCPLTGTSWEEEKQLQKALILRRRNQALSPSPQAVYHLGTSPRQGHTGVAFLSECQPPYTKASEERGPTGGGGQSPECISIMSHCQHCSVKQKPAATNQPEVS